MLLESSPRQRQAFDEWLSDISPSFAWHWRHLVYIRSYLQRMTEGHINRLMLQVPPRHGKSEMVTVRYTTYRLEIDKGLQVIVGAYNQFLANRFSRKIRRLIQERVPVARDHCQVDDWRLDVPGMYEPGGVRAVGVGSGITGQGGRLIMIDDPVKSRAEANSPTYRQAVAEWYQDDLYTRLEPGGQICLIMTRWHEDDLAGRILRNDFSDAEQWTVVNLPALAEENDPIGRREGEALCPDRFDEVALGRIAQVLGSSFNALYQGRPSAATGNIIQRKWFRYFDVMPKETTMIVQSWDTASKEGEHNDPSVCTTWAVTRLGFYLLDVYRQRVNFPDLQKARDMLASRWQPEAILIEDKSSGTALLQDARANTTLPVIGIEPQKDKVTRAVVESAQYESGLVYHPRRAPWLADFEWELMAMPNCEHDDQVDSVSQFLRWARTRTYATDIVLGGNERAAASAFDFGGF